MILQSLVQLARNERLIADPDFEFKAVAWIARLTAEGTLIVIEDNRRNLTEGQVDKRGKPAKAKWIGRKTLVPIQFVRTSGDAAYFAVDKAEYVFGVDPAGIRPADKLLDRLNLFYASLEACHAVTNDPTSAAAVAFGHHLAGLSPDGRRALLPKDLAAGDLILLRVGGDAQPLHDRPEIVAYWKGVRSPEAGEKLESVTADRRCLITSEPVTNVPLFRKVKNVPGDASGGLSLVSFNAAAWESYGWKGEDNAPVSREPAEAAITALSRLLDPRPTDGTGEPLRIRRIRMADDTAVVFWSPVIATDVQGLLDDLPDLIDPPAGATDGASNATDVTQVGNLLVAVRTGKFNPVTTPAAFYAMTITAVTGRVVVRDWFEATVAEVQANLIQHFRDIHCVRNTPRAKGQMARTPMPLGELLDALATPGREAKIPAKLASAFIHSALRGTAYPFGLLQRALVRERAEAGGDEWTDHVRRDARAALLKAVLNRRRRFDLTAVERYSEVNPSMDPTNSNAGYNLGALVAVLERLQAAALGSVNATIVDKYFAAASATPRVVFDRLLRGARHHARKAVDDPQNAGQAFLLERLIDELVSRFLPPASASAPKKPPVPASPASGLPMSLDLEEQGLFVIGYHHMRRFLWMTREERETWQAEHPDAPRAFVRKPDEQATAANTESA